jgi:hypothetical protein
VEAIVLIPAVIALIVMTTSSVERAFVGVYLVALLWLPDGLRFVTAGLPQPTFSEAAILPVGLAFAWRCLSGTRWRFSIVDVLVVAFLGWCFASEWNQVGLSDARYELFDLLCMGLLPYVLGKGLIEAGGLRVQVARRIVFSLALLTVLSLYEFRFGLNPFRGLLGGFFPEQVPDPGAFWLTQLRWGYGRISATFTHSILMGTVLAVAFTLQSWLVFTRKWERVFKGLPALPLSKGAILSLTLIAGLALTMSRGSWIATGLAAVFVAIGKAKDRWRALAFATAFTVIVGFTMYVYAQSYMAGGRHEGMSEEQDSAAYRSELVDRYVDIALQHPVWGWGRQTWPRLPGMYSIDNHYLLIALMHGVTASALLVLTIAASAVRLFKGAMFPLQLSVEDRAFRLTLLGAVMAMALSLTTVYLGAQTYPILFLLLGWSEGCLVFHKKASAMQVSVRTEAPEFRFAKVMV